MKIVLPQSITTVEEAKVFLTELQKNNEAFHPEHSALDVDWTFNITAEEMMQLDKLMEDIYNLPGNDGRHVDLVFDPCEFLNDLYNPLDEREQEEIAVEYQGMGIDLIKTQLRNANAFTCLTNIVNAEANGDYASREVYLREAIIIVRDPDYVLR